jgi:mannose-6-phosphate isomerase
MGFYPLLFEPVLKSYLWGGRNLERLGRVLPPEGVVAESWEIAAHPDGDARVVNGAYAGWRLREVQEALGVGLIGRKNHWAAERHKFPLLVKLLDACTPLSVQVHPDDAYALAHEGNELGKTEMWVILHAEPGAEVILGVKAGVSADSLRRGIETNTLEPLLHRLPVQAGDHLCVPAGTLHAILGGIVLAEVQQNSNTTYRVWDWGRVERDGTPRPLHIERALDVIDFSRPEPTLAPALLVQEEGGVRLWQLCHNRYFTVERVEMAAGARHAGVCDGESLQIWGVLTGSVGVESADNPPVSLNAVQFALLPADLGRFTIHADQPATLLRAWTRAEPGE